MRIPGRAAMVAVTALSLAACGDSDTELATLLVSSVDGYSVSPADSGPLDATAAAQSLPASDTTTRSALDAAGFSAGYSRIFMSGSGNGDYVLASVYAMSSAQQATRFVDSEKRALAGTGSVALFADPTITGSAGFILNAPTRRGGREVFCDGLLFPKAGRVYAITTCSAMPGDTVLASRVAERQAAAG